MKTLKDADSGSDFDSIRKTIKYGTKFQAIKEIFIEYFEESSIHGFRYIGEQKRPALDRIIWLGAVIVSISTCSYLIYNIWDQRNHNPVLVTLDGRLTPVWEIPFPMVTICPQIKIHNKTLNLTKEPTNLTEHEYEYDFIFLSLSGIKIDIGFKLITIFTRQYFLEFGSQTECFINGFVYNGTVSKEFIPNASKYIKIMSNLAPTFEEIMSGCFWKDRIICKDLFDPVLTEDGICFSFNLIKSEKYQSELNNFENNDPKIDWDLDHGYNEEAIYSLEAFPFHAVGAGITESFVLNPKDEIEDEDNKCRTYSQDFKLIVQTPGEVPQVKKNFINIPFNQDILLSIKPQIMTTSEGLRHYSPERRQCYYQNERYLRYYTKYTQASCELECLANQTLAKCGCVKFSMPRISSHPICGWKKSECADKIANNFGNWKFMAKTKGYGEIAYTGNCLPTCFDIKYKAEIALQTPRDGDTDGLFRLTSLTIKFEEDVVNGLIRTELYSTTDFIANCGGLLGLFMGVSILSLVELVYFFTVRLLVNLKARRQIQDVEQCWEQKFPN